MERVWREEDNCMEFDSEYGVIDRVLWWLEREDTDMDKMAGYGLCLAAVTYFVARLIQALF